MKIKTNFWGVNVLVIPRNRWLRLNMTEKLFTGTLNHNQNKHLSFLIFLLHWSMGRLKPIDYYTCKRNNNQSVFKWYSEFT